jgi:hypothetical protein
MNKRIIVLLATFALVSGFAFGESYLQNGMLIKAPGSLNMTVGVGDGLTLALEEPIGHFKVGDLTFSDGVKGFAWFPYGFGWFRVGAAGTLHFALGCLDLPKNMSWLDNFDTFVGIGAAIDFNDSGAHLGLATYGGLSYFLSRSLAITAAGGIGGSYIGVLWKML